MLGVAKHTMPLPKGWPRRVQSAVIQVISLARVARRIAPSQGRLWPARLSVLSVDHYTGIHSHWIPVIYVEAFRDRILGKERGSSRLQAIQVTLELFPVFGY